MVIKHWKWGDQVSAGTFSHCQLTQAGVKQFPTVKKVELWHLSFFGLPGCLSGIRITYSDGVQSPRYGQAAAMETFSTFTLDDGERITRMWLGVIAPHNVFGSLQISTNKGRYWQGGHPTESSAFMVNVRSGIWLGISGGLAQASNVGQLGFYFLEDLASIDLNMEFLTTPDPGSISKIAYHTIRGDNRDGPSPLTIKIDKSETTIDSSTTEESWTETFGVSVSVSGGFFGIGDASAGTDYSYSETKSKSTTYSNEHTLSWEGSTDVAPYDYVAIDLFYYTGHFTVDYKAEIVLKGKSGSRYVLTRNGKMEGVSSGVATFKQRRVDPNAIKGGAGDLSPEEETLEDKNMPPNTNEPLDGAVGDPEKLLSELRAFHEQRSKP